MSPGGHLLTTLGACALSLAATREMPAGEALALAAGIAAGGFLIDVDHAVDYVLFERQRDLRPGAFLRYYLGGRVRRTVLVLHSYELFALLAAVAWWLDAPALTGYLLGALMHLALDIAVNGEATPRSIAAFYSFAYRAVHGFDAGRLLAMAPRPVPAGFWAAFFSVPTRGSRRAAALSTADLPRAPTGLPSRPGAPDA
ncbi:MAG TPA: hypothetical protein VNK50_12030 [Calidithermus sp.]|nr:hypothetical protein [Calidithermus sp.]